MITTSTPPAKKRVKKKDKGTTDKLREYREKFAEEYEDILNDAEIEEKKDEKN